MSTTPETLVIVNTSPLLYLYQVNCLELLQQLYSTITVPPEKSDRLIIDLNHLRITWQNPLPHPGLAA